MNTKGIQDTIRYRVSQKDSSIGKLGYQSEKDIFAVMRSVYLQYGNSSKSCKILEKQNSLLDIFT